MIRLEFHKENNPGDGEDLFLMDINKGLLPEGESRSVGPAPLAVILAFAKMTLEDGDFIPSLINDFTARADDVRVEGGVKTWKMRETPSEKAVN